ncbi:uncharacterized protein LOC127645492 [Xyrauchen texanus]|uniref:uncharacterized protein LOC127645492 n=1 Tax=Xyrauchen texanus TaxID=154827 RepID=UPI002241CCB8|nr:uncharacterized protein LOC127645492 [Xyrauchen texanus]
MQGLERFCKGYGSSAFSATDPLTFGKPISLTVLPKDAIPTAPSLSIMSPLKGDGKDICLAAGFFPRDKNMILTANGKSPVTLPTTSNAPLFISSKTYYYAGFNEDDIEQCQMDQVVMTKTKTNVDIPVTDKPEKFPIPQNCKMNASSISASVFTDGPKVNSMTLLVTGLRILLAKCVAINVLMTVKAFLI